jgi:hypothetical protein
LRPLALAAGAAALGAVGYLYFRRPEGPRGMGPPRIVLVTPVIDLRVAEFVLSALEKIDGDDVDVVIHTQGGCVASCVMIAKALRHFPRSTAIVPYMAISGGTLIALNANSLQMGRNACLTAVDPIVLGTRAKHMQDEPDASLRGLARDYETAITAFVRETLIERLPPGGRLEDAMGVFMGRSSPHEWPVPREDVARLGIPVSEASPGWAGMVDARVRWW